MKSVKIVYAFLTLTALTINSLFAQVSGTSTQPMSTTSTNRQQELYDQYHGYNKKSTPTTPAPVPATTPNQTQRRTSDYGNSQPTVSTGRSQNMAPETNTSGPRIGVRGGVTYPFFTEDQLFAKPAVGFVGGLTFNFGSGTLSFQPEVNYARYNVKQTNDFLNLDVKEAADVIEVPLFLKISSGTYAGHRFFVNVGPYGTYWASASQDGKKISLSGRSGRFGFGGALGIGAALKAGPGHVTVEARGLYALGNTETGVNTDSRTINGQLTVGYSFPLGSR